MANLILLGIGLAGLFLLVQDTNNPDDSALQKFKARFLSNGGNE